MYDSAKNLIAGGIGEKTDAACLGFDNANTITLKRGNISYQYKEPDVLVVNDESEYRRISIDSKGLPCKAGHEGKYVCSENGAVVTVTSDGASHAITLIDGSTRIEFLSALCSYQYTSFRDYPQSTVINVSFTDTGLELTFAYSKGNIYPYGTKWIFDKK